MAWPGVEFVPWLIFFAARGAAARALGLRAQYLVLLDGPRPRRLLALLVGSATCYLCGVLAMFVALSAWGVPTLPAEPPVVIARVLAGSPADEAGARAGDEVRAVDGRPVASRRDVVDAVTASVGRPLALTLRGGGRERTVAVTPRTVDGRPRIGIDMGRAVVAVPPLGPRLLTAARAPWYACREGLRAAVAVVDEDRARAMGPVDIVRDDAPAGFAVALGIVARCAQVALLGLLLGAVAVAAVRGPARRAD